MMATILLVDDNKLMTDPLARSLQDVGYTVRVAHDGRQGLDMALANPPDLVVLDVMMPKLDGWAVCKGIRAQSGMPILMLTALDDEVDRILGLELGADDYLTKPFSPRELLARIRAMLRRVELDRVANMPDGQIIGGPIRVDLTAHRAFKDQQELRLRLKEFDLLSLLMSHMGEVVTRSELFDQVWGTDWLSDTRTLDVHIRWLRAKIEDDPSQPRLIQTVRGVGYRFGAGENHL